ncbi:hypothetical protein BGX27_000837 [Mortierella sp. AM989]|nr:hypothetical protein BGX27_000837 [Mortierella sp. AM989]
MFAPRSKLRRHTPPILSTTFFGWIPQLLRIPEAEILECVGLDAVVLLRFFSMSMKLFLYCMIPGLLIILPVNYYSIRDGHDPSVPDDHGGDVPPVDRKPVIQRTPLLYLFTQFTFTWVFSVLAIYTIWHTYEGYITLRRKYLLQRSKSITNRSVMVVGLPAHIHTDRSLATFYESLGVGSVESAHICRHVSALKRIIEQRTHALRNLEEAYTEYYGNPSDFPGYDPEQIEKEYDRYLNGSQPANATEDHHDDEDTNESTSLLRSQDKKRPTMRLGFLGLFGKKVDKIDHYREVFATLDKAVIKMRMSRIFAPTTIGFVTFEEMHSAQILAQTVNTQETLSCKTSPAPEPRDVYWDNLNLPPSELGVRSIVINTTVFLLIFFWSGPIGLFSSFLALESLEKLIPGVSKIAEASPALKSVIQGFLPTLGVSVFLAVVPKILEGLCVQQGIQSHSGLARSMYNKYYTFILFNVVLVFTVVGTWAQVFDKVYHNFGELTLLLAASLPRVSPFFVNYLILKGIGSFPLQLLQIGEVIEQLFHGFMSKTPRDFAEARAPPVLKHGEIYADTSLAFVIVLIYSCIKPLILVFGVIYFAMAYIIYKYQLLYVLYHPYDSGGRTWPMVYGRIIHGLLIFQSTMLGLLLLNQAYLLGVFLAPLPLGTIWFWAWTKKHYKKSAEFIPLELIRPKEVTSAPGNDRVSRAAIGPPTQVPGHVLINVDQNNGAPDKALNGGSGNNGIAVATATDVITPGGTRRRIPKSVVENDDYQAIPERYTDYRQPPMTLYPGVLNSGMRQYSHPAISGPLPTLWLPLKKGDGKKSDEESRIGVQYSDSDSDSDDEHHTHERIEAALAGRPLMLPTQSSDAPQTFEESDNLIGGGQDMSLSTPPPAQAKKDKNAAPPAAVPAAAPVPAQNRAPQAISGPSTTAQAETSSNSAPATDATDATPSRSPSKRNSAVDGVKDVYYHHPEKKGHAATRPAETVQRQESRSSVLDELANRDPSNSNVDAPK